MTAATLNAAEILSALAGEKLRRHIEAQAWELVSAGASGRHIMRSAGLLGICWTGARADNNSFIPALRALAQAGVPVPQLLAERPLPEQDGGACLVEDLGRQDLLCYRDAPAGERLEAYRQAFRAVLALHRSPAYQELQPPFDSELYAWEQAYFAEHFLGRHLGRSTELPPDFRRMAQWLAALPRGLVHRDCQSQNIMLRGGRAYLIDFQGMRLGRWEYDLASLLYDPYMALPRDEREALYRIWQEEGGPAAAPAIYSAAAMQRLMQALGAFANIGYNQQKDWYLRMIPRGIAALRDAAANCPDNCPATPVAQWLLPLLDS